MIAKELAKIVSIIEDPEYVVTWVDCDTLRILENKVTEENNELMVFFQIYPGYIDLYNITSEELKVYKEVPALLC